MDQSPKTIRVLRHGSELSIPAESFNPATDTRLDPEPSASEQTGGAARPDARPAGGKPVGRTSKG